jgi:hypothetical protein
VPDKVDVRAIRYVGASGPNRTLTKVRDAAVQLSQSGRWRILQHFLDQNIGQTCRSPFHFLI